MSPHPMWTDPIGRELNAPPRPRALHTPPGWWARLRARIFAARYDHALEAGENPLPGTALALHCLRLASAQERDQLARALRLVLADATADASGWGRPRVPVRREAVNHAAAIIDDLIGRLEEPRGIRVRGMARLRMLLSDGRGPLYRSGSGSLNAALRGVLAAL